ncbi:MAG: hypothetical protein CVU90_02770 [Firmicutes bacterium HGW-Firmicutes-15]|nr:MAG: hypothetical protein CVU90_02770 [Firmicutes bacterium HGW-Firmicutes-15]
MIINIHKHRFAFALLSIVFFLVSGLLIYKYNTGKTGNTPQSDNVTLVGAFLNWDEVKGDFPKNAEATVIDVDSQLSFRVQRRGGYNHVDVQPLTSADSATMKKIYNGNWTWKRKAVVIKLDNGQMIAASMNGMPHGQGAISGNDFNGHFCIHFKNSKTHGSKKVDMAHQLMIWKAANVLDQQLALLNPQEIVGVFITAIDQKDMKIAAKLIDSTDNIEPLLRSLETIDNIKADKINKVEGNRFRVDLRLVFNNSKNEIRKNIVINTIEKEEYWKIEAQSLTDLLDQNVLTELQPTSVVTMEEDWD